MTPLKNQPALWETIWPWPDDDTHKYRRGHLGCVTGPPSSTGAARLAAQSGLRVGTGLVTLLSPPASVLVNTAHSTATMVKPFSSPEQLADLCSRMDCVVIGPAAGLESQLVDHVRSAIHAADAAIIDADAITVFKGAAEDLFSMIKKPAVLTPHTSEFERLFPGLLEQYGRIDAARHAASKSGAIVILKGRETVISSPDGRLALNTHASPFLATAGSGDVLAGMTGGLIAQGMPAFEAACAAVWVHGDCGIRHGPGLIAEDIPQMLPTILSDLYALRP